MQPVLDGTSAAHGPEEEEKPEKPVELVAAS
jgi:hypothetical protein